MRWLRRLRCWLFGHRRNVEDLGGVVYEVCDRCPWVGRHFEYPVQVVTFSVEFGKAVAEMDRLARRNDG
jgi:hypothetical protein